MLIAIAMLGGWKAKFLPEFRKELGFVVSDVTAKSSWWMFFPKPLAKGASEEVLLLICCDDAMSRYSCFLSLLLTLPHYTLMTVSS